MEEVYGDVLLLFELTKSLLFFSAVVLSAAQSGRGLVCMLHGHQLPRPGHCEGIQGLAAGSPHQRHCHCKYIRGRLKCQRILSVVPNIFASNVFANFGLVTLLSLEQCLQFERFCLQHVQMVNKTSSFKTKFIYNNAKVRRVNRNIL